MTISNDLKQRVLKAYREQPKPNRAAIARRFDVSPNSIKNWLQEELSDQPPRPETRGRPPALSPQALAQLQRLVQQDSSATEPELAAALADCGLASTDDGSPLHRSIIGRALRSMGLTRKKRHGEPVSKTEKTSKTNEESG